MSDTQENAPKPQGEGGGENRNNNRNRNNRNRNNRNRNRKPRSEEGGEKSDSPTEGKAPTSEGSNEAKEGQNRNNRNRNRNRNRKPQEKQGENGGSENNAEGQERSSNNRNSRNRNRNRNKNNEPAKEVRAGEVSEEVQERLSAESELYANEFESDAPEALEYEGTVLDKPVVGITCGDLNGIGLEVIIKALEDERMVDFCTPVIFASSKVLSYHRNAIDKRDFNYFICDRAADAREGKVNLVNLWNDDIEINLGTPTDISGQYALKSIDSALEAAKAGEIHAIVTAPINKHNIAEAVEGFSGHTGYLAKAMGDDVLMILTSEHLRVATVTGHVPIAKVAENLSQKGIETALEILVESLKKDFGIIRPKVAVLGLNPHAGEWGTIGTEEQEIIAPAIAAMQNKKSIVKGPFPADGFFGQGFESKFDAVLGMYHDQVLVPFKSIAMGGGTNFTAGLSAVRTSPDHGTAMHMAGKGCADEGSMRAAIFAAVDIWHRRTLHEEMLANPLKKQKAKD